MTAEIVTLTGQPYRPNVIALQRSTGGASIGISPALAALLVQRRLIEAALRRATMETDRLEFAIARGEPWALARQNELPALVAARKVAEGICDQLIEAIEEYPSRTLGDVLVKLRAAAEVHGSVGALGSAIEDLERLTAGAMVTP